MKGIDIDFIICAAFIVLMILLPPNFIESEMTQITRTRFLESDYWL